MRNGISRVVRNLAALERGSTSRVLNLMAVAITHAETEEYRQAPLFDSPVLNRSIFLKHRVRADEAYLFDNPKPVALKIIIPFDSSDLRVGGKSIFYGQRSCAVVIREVGNYGNKTPARDLATLQLLDSVPSLDPFLLREQFRGHGISVADCYLEISRADKESMHNFVAGDIRDLIGLATGGDMSMSAGPTARLVAALLSTETSDRLDPLRATLRLNGDEFREGLFSWRGFLYYKWCIVRLRPELKEVLREAIRARAIGVTTSEQMAYLSEAKEKLVRGALQTWNEVKKILDVYDNAYSSLVSAGDPRSFRNFLLSAPEMFLRLGDRVGAISHITSFWRYRFPASSKPTALADELVSIFQDFEASFADTATEGKQEETDADVVLNSI